MSRGRGRALALGAAVVIGMVGSGASAASAEAASGRCSLVNLVACLKIGQQSGGAASGGSPAAQCSLLNIGACLRPSSGTGARATAPCSLLNLGACLNPILRPPAPPPGPVPVPPSGNPHNLQPLPPIVKGQPLYEPVRGRLPFGLADSETVNAATADRGAPVIAGTGASMARIMAVWPWLEMRRGQYNWSELDAMYLRLVKEGIRPAFLILGTPRWAVDIISQALFCNGNACSVEPSSQYLGDLARLGRELARRYPLLAGLEYRNEPNYGSRAYTTTPETYARGLATFYAGVRETSDHIPVWGGSLANQPGWEHWAYKFLAQHAPMDALSLHPYDLQATYSHMWSTFAKLDELLTLTGRKDLRLVVSESGAPVSQPSGAGNIAFTDGPVDHRETQYQRVRKIYEDLDARPAGYVPPPLPIANVENVDAVIFYSAFPEASDADYGWANDSTSPPKPRDIWCRWRTEVAGLATWQGSSALQSCVAPASRATAAAPRATPRINWSRQRLLGR